MVIAVLRQRASLLQVGDWGRRGQYNQSHVAAMMGLKASLLGPDFIISVGDNYYPSEAQLHGFSTVCWAATWRFQHGQ